MKIQINVLLEKSPWWATILALVFSVFALVNGYISNQTAKESLRISSEVYKSKNIPRLLATPLSAKFYVPENAVPGQVKIDMSAVIQNLSETDARSVSLNFETEDWTGFQTSLFKIYRDARQPIPHFLLVPKNSQLIYPSYAPDVPATGEAGFVNQDKSFKLKLTLYWEDINDQKYVYVGFYELRSALLPNGKRLLYFQPISTFDSVKDKEAAWNHAKQTS